MKKFVVTLIILSCTLLSAYAKPNYKYTQKDSTSESKYPVSACAQLDQLYREMTPERYEEMQKKDAFLKNLEGLNQAYFPTYRGRRSKLDLFNDRVKFLEKKCEYENYGVSRTQKYRYEVEHSGQVYSNVNVRQDNYYHY